MISRYNKKYFSGRKREKIRKQEEQIRLRIMAHAQSLAEEMNLRLLLMGVDAPREEDVLLNEIFDTAGERELWCMLCSPQHTLFVESVTVTEIVFPEKKQGCLCRLNRILMRLLHWLRTLFANEIR